MGGEVPKQFLPIGGRPVLMHTIEAFLDVWSDIHIILVLPHDQQERWVELCEAYKFDVPLQIADGGDSRFHSVQNGLALIPDDTEGVVGVHDGVRPFVSRDTIRRCYQGAEEHGAVVPVVPVVETVRQMLPEGDSLTVDRELFRLVQTPQTFRLAVLKKAYLQPYQKCFTDDASVVEESGHPIMLVDGNRENIKLTTPTDLKVAELFVENN
jgi:2-C-methyl-D-erythritol 4-phosphate cytidylyltransferase